MERLLDFVDAVERYEEYVAAEIQRARRDPAFADELRGEWKALRASVGTTRTPTGIELPRVALPETDEPGEIARFLLREGPPGRFPYATAAYPEMYIDGAEAAEEPTRLFAGLGLAEDTNRRFHELVGLQRSARLSTAFDGPTLYGLDSDTPGLLGKVGEGGVAIDTLEDMERLYAGFDLADPGFSVSMTINGPAPVILAMYVAAARRQAIGRLREDLGREPTGPEAEQAAAEATAALRGTVQADILKEVQAQNESIFPLEPSLRFLADMVDWVTAEMPRWYPISISGYHITEAGATPAEQAAFTLANGFTYVAAFRERGMPVERFGPRLSFFLDCGLDVEYLVLGRVCRRLWAIAMRDVFGASPRAQLFRLHTQTSGRSLIAQRFRNNLTRTAIELMLAYLNYTNSCHSNSADEPFTTPSAEYVGLASNAQAILLEESGLFKHTMNLLGGSPGMQVLEARVQEEVLRILREIESLGGVLAAVESRYFRARIQESALRYERQVNSGERPVIGLNRYAEQGERPPSTPLARTPIEKQRAQVEHLRAFKARHSESAPAALDRLESVVAGALQGSGGNFFGELVRTVEHCSLGQITGRLQEVVGRFRPML